MIGKIRLQWAALPAERNLWLGLGVSLFLHALVLALNFKYPDASRAFQDKALDIILVNSKSATRPTHAQALAQANLDGGGHSEQNRRTRTPLPASSKQQSGDELEQAEKRAQALEAQQQRLMAEARSKGFLSRSGKEAQPDPAHVPSGRDLASNALAMARLEGEIARDTEEYNKRPRVKQLGASVQEYRFAQYIEDWRIKVERVGTLNYPEAAKGKLYGSLLLSVKIKNDGSVVSVEINRSSGHRILDDAARRIVSMAGPYAAFPPEIRRDFDVLEIVRTWSFTNNKLETK
ncbi:MAG: energy transducer TonB [Betaproteobacteria bacterium]